MCFCVFLQVSPARFKDDISSLVSSSTSSVLEAPNVTEPLASDYVENNSDLPSIEARQSKSEISVSSHKIHSLMNDTISSQNYSHKVEQHPPVQILGHNSGADKDLSGAYSTLKSSSTLEITYLSTVTTLPSTATHKNVSSKNGLEENQLLHRRGLAYSSLSQDYSVTSSYDPRHSVSN